MERLTMKKRFEYFRPYEDVTAVCVNGYAQICDSENDFYIAGKAVDKLAEYEDTEEQGLLLKLPCKVGDEFYIVAYRDDKIIRVKCTGYTIQVDTLNKIDHSYICVDSVEKPSDYWKVSFDEFNNWCFVTKEEAEKTIEKFKR